MLCPEGYEGLVYAILTTIANLSGSIASNIGSLLTLIWDVSNITIEKGDYSGVLHIAILTSCLQLFPLCLVWYIYMNKYIYTYIYIYIYICKYIYINIYIYTYIYIHICIYTYICIYNYIHMHIYI
jgi:hypothetical protein